MAVVLLALKLLPPLLLLPLSLLLLLPCCMPASTLILSLPDPVHQGRAGG